jgi:hypothetical protein
MRFLERLLAGGALASASISCGSYDPPFVGQVSRSQVFEYHDQVTEPLCATLLPLLDEHARQVGGAIGFDPRSGDPPIRYYKFRDYDAFQASGECPSDSGGCEGGDALFTPWAFEAHEQAHAYVSRVWGDVSVGLLNEGEAVALSCEPLRFIEPGQRPSDVVGSIGWRDALHLDAESRDGYHAAGYFVTHLAERYGWASVGSLHRRVPFDVSAADFEQAFSEVYPIAIDQAWSEALDTPGAHPCFKGWLCGATPMTVGEDAPPACDGQMHRSVTVTDQAGVGLSIHGGNGELTLVKGCADPAPPWIELSGGVTRATHWVNLTPGTYTLAEMAVFGVPDGVAFQGYLPQGFLADTCDAAGVLPLDDQGDTYLDLLPNEVVSGWIGLSGGEGRAYIAEAFGILSSDTSTPVPVAVCDGCGPEASCVSLFAPSGDGLVTLGQHAVIHFDEALVTRPFTSPADPGPYVLFSPSSRDGGP